MRNAVDSFDADEFLLNQEDDGYKQNSFDAFLEGLS